ncbi:MAG: pesticidal protein Cry15Aa [Chloroflexi bacterium]|nr:pesticidal protein Cry15Aa [Chloroflexota bacterium]MCI0575705.1 pesticidal protein Cry15Aa [Chloroflexota bacterium]MCI0648047.1 pesticidal protein Cry15Aa [Chloroflexota bacterium]MCI0725808.1 pesticidal protein Cry15Aa [Chloroflexota bacterium]
MQVIKRYPNRKLYNTGTKQYITLDEIAELIREGEEVQVLDHASGEDLTALTLSQIIFEQEKKKGGFLPRSVLTGLIQTGGERVSSLRRNLISSLDLFHHVDQEIERRLQTLVNRGEIAQEEGARLRDKLLALSQRSRDEALTEETLEQFLDRRGVPSREDLQQLSQQLEELMSKLEEIAPDDDSM